MKRGNEFPFDFQCEPKVLQLIGTYCKFLKRFGFEYSTTFLTATDFNDFWLKCCQSLEYLSYNMIVTYDMRTLMPPINKIKTLHMKVSPLNAKDLIEERFSKIEEISFQSSDFQNMLLFTDKFHSKINKISIYFDTINFTKVFFTQDVINEYLLQICRFKGLIKLKLNFRYTKRYSPIDESLRTIGKKLLKLKYLFIESMSIPDLNENEQFFVLYENYDPIKGDLFPILAEFKTIEYLKIVHISKNNRFGSIQSLKSCKNLKYLSIISDRNFSEEEIEEYKFHFSGLSYLEINCCNRKFSL
jgi:hypothetical protein